MLGVQQGVISPHTIDCSGSGGLSSLVVEENPAGFRGALAMSSQVAALAGCSEPENESEEAEARTKAKCNGEQHEKPKQQDEKEVENESQEAEARMKTKCNGEQHEKPKQQDEKEVENESQEAEARMKTKCNGEQHEKPEQQDEKEVENESQEAEARMKTKCNGEQHEKPKQDEEKVKSETKTECKCQQHEQPKQHDEEEVVSETKIKCNGEQHKTPKQQDEGGVESEPDRYNIVKGATNSKVVTEAPMSDSIPIKRVRDANGVNGLNGARTEVEPMSKKRMVAKDVKVQLLKGQQQREGGKKPKKDFVFQYGNYHRYYGYRLGRTVDEDPRLKCFQKEWFEGRDCLDIGCNEGFVTISIAQKYKCRSILGVDIDHFLIKKATRNLKEAAAASDSLQNGSPPGAAAASDSFQNGSLPEAAAASDSLQNGSPPEAAAASAALQNGSPPEAAAASDSLQNGSPPEEAAASAALQNGSQPEEGHLEETLVVRTLDNADGRCSERAGNQSAMELGNERSCAGHGSLLQKVKFRQEQFIEDFPYGDYMKDGLFDTVLCLSVTKWIHLNWGDTGLIRLFAKIHHILRPGGVLILEPQPWKSYEKKYFVSAVTKRCYENIQLTPSHFREVLLDKIGFKSVEEVSAAVPNSSLGFDRSLFLYIK